MATSDEWRIIWPSQVSSLSLSLSLSTLVMMCVSRAALGAAEGVSEVIKAVEGDETLVVMEDDKEEFLYTAFYKGVSLSGCGLLCYYHIHSIEWIKKTGG